LSYEDEIQASPWDESAFFPMDNEGRYMIRIKVLSADGSCAVETECVQDMSEVEIASDPGADMILLTKKVADKLGYVVDLIPASHNFFVQGKSGEPTTFKEVQTWIQIGNMKPLNAPVGLAVDEDALIENLFGNRGTLDSGLIVAQYDHTGVEYRDAMQIGSQGGGGTILSYWRS
jgi:hypothetical protein